MSYKKIEGNKPCRDGHFALVVSRFNSLFCNRLLDGALDTLRRSGEVPEENITVVKVPGSVEIPLVCMKLAKSGSYDAIIALGCVIRGDTYHFEIVANECAKGLTQVMLETGVPVSNGVLTTENQEQAEARSGSHTGNKGSEAASAALEMANICRQI